MTRIIPLLLAACALPALDLSQEDKRAHFAGGAMIGVVTDHFLTEFTDLTPFQRFLVSTATATAVGLAKELHDRTGSGTYDTRDLWATAAGGAAGAALSLTITWEF
jgi:hypothetical protein